MSNVDPSSTHDSYPTGPQTKLKRHPERGSHERAQIHAILDEALVCQLAYLHEGTPYSMPTAYARDGEVLYVHGAIANRSLAAIASGAPFSLTVMILDGLVLAHSGFHHSMNYRSVVVLGSARIVDDASEKRRAMDLLVERMAPGRSAAVRPMHDWEADATRVLAVHIEQSSAKTRTGGTVEMDDDRAHPIWAGVIPLRSTRGEPIPEVECADMKAPISG